MFQSENNPVDDSIINLINEIRAIKRRLDRLDTQLFLGEGCRIFHDANQSINSAAITTLTFNSEDWDTDGLHDLIVNPERITIQHTGKYVIVAQAEWQTDGTNARRITIRLNGATLIAQDTVQATGTTTTGHRATTIAALAKDDYLEMRVLQNSGGALNILATAEFSPYFMAIKVG